MDNANSKEYLQKIKLQVIENLRQTTFAPSVQMTDVPKDPAGLNDEADAEMDDLDADTNPDSRSTQRRWDKHTEKEGELSESDDEAQSAANGVRKIGQKMRKNHVDHSEESRSKEVDSIPGDVDMSEPKPIETDQGSADAARLATPPISVSPAPAESGTIAAEEAPDPMEEGDTLDDTSLPQPGEPVADVPAPDPAIDGPQEAHS